MRRFGWIAVSALSLLVAFVVTATAHETQQVVHRAKHAPRAVPAYDAYGEPLLPVENALRWGYSQGYSHYPSGFGGLYGDGRYPGNTISNPNYPTWW